MTLRRTGLIGWAFFLTLISAMPATAQAGVEASQVFIEVRACIDAAKTSFKVDSFEDGIRQDIDDTFTKLKGKWGDGVKRKLAPEYLASLQSYCPLFQQATSSQMMATERRDILRYIKKDVSAKLGAIGGVGHAFPTMVSMIAVTVRTFRDDVEAKGYLVRCNPKLLGITSSAKFPFNDESSPTRRKLPPGFYACWVEDKDGTPITKPRDIEIINANGEEIRISL